MYEDKALLPWQTTKWTPTMGRDCNRNAVELSHILKKGRK